MGVMATRAVRLIDQLTHSQGPAAGEPFHLRPWQKAIVKKLFTQRRDGLRQYRQALLMLPRKNGKTELAAALAVYFLLFDHEIGAEVYSAAAEKEQAARVFAVAAAMIEHEPDLAAQCEILESRKRIVHRGTRSFYQAISAEAYSKHGQNPSFVVYDELHAAPNRELWDVLASSQSARAQPLMLAISTAGYDRHSILYELYAHAKAVQENPALDPSFLPMLFEAPAEADWRSEKVWKACNPALGDFRSLEEMRASCARAVAIPAQENSFRRLYLNQWTEQASRWLGLDAWDQCQGAPADLAGRSCYLGLDLSSTQDLTALVAVFPDDDHFDVLPVFFVPAENIRDRTHRDRVPYDDWAKRGILQTTPGNSVDYDYVRRTVNAWARDYDVQCIGVDPWNARGLITQLAEQDGLPVIEVRQGFASLSAPSKALEAAILSRRLRHTGHEILRWCIGNVALETDAAGNIKPSKKASTERIDGVVALVMAIDQMDRQQRAIPDYSVQVVG